MNTSSALGPMGVSGGVSSQHLVDDHVQLANLCGRVIATFEEGDREACDAAFRELERALEEHLRFEERELLPGFARANPAEAAALRADHAHFRALLTELGVGVDLHVTRCNAVRQLVVELAAHAHREGAVLYPWVDQRGDER